MNLNEEARMKRAVADAVELVMMTGTADALKTAVQRQRRAESSDRRWLLASVMITELSTDLNTSECLRIIHEERARLDDEATP